MEAQISFFILLTQQQPRARSPRTITATPCFIIIQTHTHTHTLRLRLIFVFPRVDSLCCDVQFRCSTTNRNKDCQPKCDVSLCGGDESWDRKSIRQSLPRVEVKVKVTPPPHLAAFLTSCLVQASWTGSQRRCSGLDAWSS